MSAKCCITAGTIDTSREVSIECSGTQSGQEHVHYFNIYVSLETGKLGYIYNMDLVWMDPA